MPRTVTITALTSLLLLVSLSAASAGTSYQILHSFADKPDTCPEPMAPVVFDESGNLYGTTSFWNGCVFELMPEGGEHWKEHTLHDFPKYGGTDGAQPWAPVAFDTAGNAYGNTVGGGGSGCFNLGCGTIFEMTPASDGHWEEKVIYRFKDPGDGYSPEAGLAIDRSR